MDFKAKSLLKFTFPFTFLFEPKSLSCMIWVNDIFKIVFIKIRSRIKPVNIIVFNLHYPWGFYGYPSLPKSGSAHVTIWACSTSLKKMPSTSVKVLKMLQLNILIWLWRLSCRIQNHNLKMHHYQVKHKTHPNLCSVPPQVFFCFSCLFFLLVGTVLVHLYYC